MCANPETLTLPSPRGRGCLSRVHETFPGLRALATVAVYFFQSIEFGSNLPDALFSLLGSCIDLVQFGVKRNYQARGRPVRTIRKTVDELPEGGRGAHPVRNRAERVRETQAQPQPNSAVAAAPEEAPLSERADGSRMQLAAQRK